MSGTGTGHGDIADDGIDGSGGPVTPGMVFAEAASGSALAGNPAEQATGEEFAAGVDDDGGAPAPIDPTTRLDSDTGDVADDEV